MMESFNNELLIISGSLAFYVPLLYGRITACTRYFETGTLERERAESERGMSSQGLHTVHYYVLR